MNKFLMSDLMEQAKANDYIKIEYRNKEITFKKGFIDYIFLNAPNDVHLKIYDSSRKETYLFTTDIIDVVTLIKPKFKGMTWNSQRAKAKAGA